MRVLLWALLLFLAGINSAAAYRITNDRGGRIGDYIAKYQDMRASGEQVIIDGLCASACTLAIGIIPRDHLCVTHRAKLGFHQAWDEGTSVVNGRQVTIMKANDGASNMVYHYYPRPVRDWIFLHGSLPEPWRLLKLSGKELAKFVPVCGAPQATIY